MAELVFPFAIITLANVAEASSLVELFKESGSPHGVMWYNVAVDSDWGYVNDLIRNVIRFVNRQRAGDRPGRLVIDVRDTEWRDRYCAIIRTIVEGMLPSLAECQTVVDQFIFVRFL